MPAVSVVVPSYNHAPYLDRRICSILDQTFQDFDLLVIDDASTDDSPQVLSRYANHPRVTIQRQPHNSGSPFVQWNRGVRATSAPLVWIAESDDECEPRFLERMVGCLDAHPACGLAYSQSWAMDAAGVTDGTLRRWTDSVDATHWCTDYVNTGRDEIAQYLAVSNTIPNASAVVFRREVFEKVGGAPDGMRLAGDWMTWVRMLLVSDVAFVAEPLNRHRSHDATVRTAFADAPRWWQESLDVWRHVYDRLELPDTTRTRIADIVREVIVRLLPRAAACPQLVRSLYAFGCQLHPRFGRSLARMLVTRGLGALARHDRR